MKVKWEGFHLRMQSTFEPNNNNNTKVVFSFYVNFPKFEIYGVVKIGLGKCEVVYEIAERSEKK